MVNNGQNCDDIVSFILDSVVMIYLIPSVMIYVVMVKSAAEIGDGGAAPCELPSVGRQDALPGCSPVGPVINPILTTQRKIA